MTKDEIISIKQSVELIYRMTKSETVVLNKAWKDSLTEVLEDHLKIKDELEKLRQDYENLTISLAIQAK